MENKIEHRGWWALATAYFNIGVSALWIFMMANALNNMPRLGS